MSRNNSLLSWARIAISVVSSGVVLCSQAAASVISPGALPPPSQDSSGWADLRAELGKAENSQALDDELHAIVSAARSSGRLDAMIRQSYAMAAPDQIEGLDRLWMDTLATMADTEAMQSYMSVRSTLAVADAGSADYYLENWLWKTTVPADCDGD